MHRRNILLTCVIFGPLLLAFATETNFYPIPVWSLFSDAGQLSNGHVHYVMYGKIADEWHQLPPIQIVGALHNRLFMVASYTDSNLPLQISSPHPTNVRLIGTTERGARMPDLLKGFGRAYNARHFNKLSAIRVDALVWKGGEYTDFEQPDYSWEVAL